MDENMGDRIVLRDVELLMRVGMNRHERAMPQMILVDITLRFPLGKAARFDDLARTVDYRPILEYLKSAIVPLEFNTIEALAENIQQAVRYVVHNQHPREKCGVQVTAKKPEAKLPLPARYPGVVMGSWFTALTAPSDIIRPDMRTAILKSVNAMYTREQLGYVHVLNALEPRFTSCLRNELARAHFTQSPSKYGSAVQRLSSFALGIRGPNENNSSEQEYRFPELQALWQTVNVLYAEIGERAGYEPNPPVNSVSVHAYPTSEGGLSAHRDESCFVNLIVAVTIDGEAMFSVGKDRSLKGADRFLVGPRSLVLLRAPRNETEKSWRPMHAVGTVIKERTSIMFRAHHEGEK